MISTANGTSMLGISCKIFKSMFQHKIFLAHLQKWCFSLSCWLMTLSCPSGTPNQKKSDILFFQVILYCPFKSLSNLFLLPRLKPHSYLLIVFVVYIVSPKQIQFFSLPLCKTYCLSSGSQERSLICTLHIQCFLWRQWMEEEEVGEEGEIHLSSLPILLQWVQSFDYLFWPYKSDFPHWNWFHCLET